MKALIFENRVIQIEQQPFDVHESLIWVDALENVTVGWHYINGHFLSPETQLLEE